MKALGAIIGLGVLAVGGGIAYAASRKKQQPTCNLPTEQMIFQANQAIATGDPAAILAVANVFMAEDCQAEADALIAEAMKLRPQFNRGRVANRARVNR